MGYITGVGEMMAMAGMAIGSSDDAKFGALALCGHPSGAAAVEAFINWAEENPRYWNAPQLAGVVVALGSAWPCQKQ
jgi:hypothetical protein